MIRIMTTTQARSPLVEWVEEVARIIDETRFIGRLRSMKKYVRDTIRWALNMEGRWAARFVEFFRTLQTLIERCIQVLLGLLPFFMQELVLIEANFFEYNGLGRPPRTLSRALIAGLSQVTGRVCSSPALA